MIDDRKLTSQQLLEAGIIDLPIHPDPDNLPDSFESVGEETNPESFDELLESGTALSAAMYYGFWRLWPTEDGW